MGNEMGKIWVKRDEDLTIYEVKKWLELNERTPAWLGRQLKVSSTLVYMWFKNQRRFSDVYKGKIKELM